MQWILVSFTPPDALARAARDSRDDSIVKSELLDRIGADGYEPWLAIDDR